MSPQRHPTPMSYADEHAAAFSRGLEEGARLGARLAGATESRAASIAAQVADDHEHEVRLRALLYEARHRPQAPGLT
jgi:hypothetical protein